MTLKRSRHMRCATACALAGMILAGQRATAQQIPQPPSDDHALVEQLLKRVEELEQQVKALRQSTTGAPPVEAVRGAQAAPLQDRQEPPEPEGPAQPAGEVHDMGIPGGAGLQIRGFADIDFQAINGDPAPKTFRLGQLDLFLASRMSDQFSFVGEVVLEANEANTFGVDVERMILQYAPSDHFKVGAGRYHTAIGYYNTAYHHGNWFQTATGRPFIFRFEDAGGIMPVHSVGVTVQGRIPSGRAGLRYVAEIANGRRSRSPADEAVQNVVDENEHKAVNFALIARPDWLTGLQAGFSVYRDQLTPEGHPRVGETIMAGHVIYQTPAFEQFNEAIVIRHRPEGGAVFNTTSAYSQISRQFARYRPYFRYEYLDVPAGDFLFGDVDSRHGPSVGLRYDIADLAAIKLQYDRLARRARAVTNGLTVQLAFTF